MNIILKNFLCKQLYTFLFILLMAITSSAYVTQPGDTIANIVRRFYVGKVFGPEGGVAKILSLNKHITTPNNVQPGTYIRLPKDNVKPGVTLPKDENEEMYVAQEKVEVETAEADKDSAEGLSPHIEIEKYDSKTSTSGLQRSVDDKINFFSKFYFNNLSGRNSLTRATYNFNTATETDLGFEYYKLLSEGSYLFQSVSLNYFSIPAVSLLVPQLEASAKTQGAATLGWHYKYVENNYLDLSLKYRPYYYLIEKDNGNMLVEHKLSPALGLQIEYQFYDNDDFIVGLDTGVEYISNTLNSGGGSALGSTFNFGLIYQQDFKSNDLLRAKLNYQQSTLDSSTYNLVTETVSLSFLYSLPY